MPTEEGEEEEPNRSESAKEEPVVKLLLYPMCRSTCPSGPRRATATSTTSAAAAAAMAVSRRQQPSDPTSTVSILRLLDVFSSLDDDAMTCNSITSAAMDGSFAPFKRRRKKKSFFFLKNGRDKGK